MSITGLPEEIVGEVFSHMNLRDAESLTEACCENSDLQDKANRSMVDRSSVCRYLRSTFDDPDELLDAMAYSNCCISGSRAADFFVPGTAVQSSDWDFYVEGSKVRVYAFMKYMESIGTKWQSAVLLIEDAIQTENQNCRVAYRDICHMLDYAKARYTSLPFDKVHLTVDNHDEGRTYRWAIDNIPNMGHTSTQYDVRREGSTLYVKYVTENDVGLAGFVGVSYTFCDTILNVINGVMHRKNDTVKVQLVVCDNTDHTSPMMPVIKFHSTCVQAIIGPYSAIHMYYELSSGHNYYSWPENRTGRTMDAEESTDVRRKFELRGYTVSDWTRCHKVYIRTATDWECKIVWYDDRNTKLAQRMVSQYTSEMATLTWAEGKDGTCEMTPKPYFKPYGQISSLTSKPAPTLVDMEDKYCMMHGISLLPDYRVNH